MLKFEIKIEIGNGGGCDWMDFEFYALNSEEAIEIAKKDFTHDLSDGSKKRIVYIRQIPNFEGPQSKVKHYIFGPFW